MKYNSLEEFCRVNYFTDDSNTVTNCNKTKEEDKTNIEFNKVYKAYEDSVDLRNNDPFAIVIWNGVYTKPSDLKVVKKNSVDILNRELDKYIKDNF